MAFFGKKVKNILPIPWLDITYIAKYDHSLVELYYLKFVPLLDTAYWVKINLSYYTYVCSDVYSLPD